MNSLEELFNGSIFQISAYMRKGSLAPDEMAFLWRKHVMQKDVYNCFINISDQKDMAETFMGSPLNSHILGLPYAVSDNICIKEHMSTCASKAFSYLPGFDAECVQDMSRAGAAVLGRLNMAELGVGWNAKAYDDLRIRIPKGRKAAVEAGVRGAA